MIVKLHAYGLDLVSLKILQDYLIIRKQRIKVDSIYSSLEKILSFICDIFLILKITSFTGYADDNTPFVVRENTTNFIKALEDIGKNLIKWFSDNQMKLNTDNHIEEICKKTSRKLNALARIAPYMGIRRRRT